MNIFQQIWKKLGFHVHKFDLWERKVIDVERDERFSDLLACPPNWGERRKIQWTEYWQERKCKDCGYVQRRRIKST